jgi:hypothetical protein
MIVGDAVHPRAETMVRFRRINERYACGRRQARRVVVPPAQLD